MEKSRKLEMVAIMFVDQTAGDLLAKSLQKAEDRVAEMVGYRIKMVIGGVKWNPTLPASTMYQSMEWPALWKACLLYI